MLCAQRFLQDAHRMTLGHLKLSEHAAPSNCEMMSLASAYMSFIKQCEAQKTKKVPNCVLVDCVEWRCA